MSSQIAMIIANQDLQTKVNSQLPKHDDFEFVTFSSISDFFERGVSMQLSGIIADVKSMISPSPYKNELLTISEVFPFLRLRAEAGGVLTGSIANENHSGMQMWEAFFSKFAKAFPVRPLRKFPRQSRLVAVEYCFGDEPINAFRRSYTFDVSSKGMYLIAPDANPTVKQIRIRLARDTAHSYDLNVAWNKTWDTNSGSKPAGFGLQIETMPAILSDQLGIKVID